MLLAAAGVFDWPRAAAATPVWRERLLLIAFVAYIVVTAQVVDAAQSRHRAPAEFALCVLALAGWAALRGKKESHAR